MSKVTLKSETVVTGVTITLSREEAQILRYVLGHISGTGTIRELANELWNELPTGAAGERSDALKGAKIIREMEVSP